MSGHLHQGTLFYIYFIRQARVESEPIKYERVWRVQYEVSQLLNNNETLGRLHSYVMPHRCDNINYLHALLVIK